MSAIEIFQQLWNGKKLEGPQDCLAQIESRSKFYLRLTILIIFRHKPRHPCAWGALFPDGFPAEGSVYSTLAA